MIEAAKVQSEWKTWRFDQIAINVNERIDNPAEANVEHYVGLEHLDPDSLKIRRWGTPDDVEATKLRFKKGDIIFGRRRAYQRKLAVAEFDGICSAHAMVLRPRPEVVLPEFLPFFLQSDVFMKRALEISVGSLSPTINWKTLAVQTFSLPPLDEQERLAAFLRALEECSERYLEALESLLNMEEALFANSLKGELTKYTQKRKESKFGLIPENWPILPIEQVASVAYGISEAVSSNTNPKLGWPILTGANITLEGKLDFSKLVYIAPPKKEEFILKEGDILLNWRSGSQEHVGKAAIFDQVGEFTYASFILRVRVGERTNRYFLWRLLNYMRKHRLFGGATSQQVNFKMNASMFREVEVVLPPRAIQDEIVQMLEEIWSARHTVEAQISTLRSLKTEILGEQRRV
jgi:restriction endonuclease S subunit